MLNHRITRFAASIAKRKLAYTHLALFGASSILLLWAENYTVGLPLLMLGASLLLITPLHFSKHFALIYFPLLVLALTPIGTSTSQPEAGFMAAGLMIALLTPYLVTRFVYKEKLIRFPSLRERHWNKNRTYYLILTAVICYLIMPPILRETNSYPNWVVDPSFWELTESYIGLNLVGIWDELFFVCTLLAILRKHFPFFVANIFQAILFASFLNAVGFESWSALVVFGFALLQGHIFKVTKSLLYILAIHLTIDLMLHLSLIYLHHPHLVPYFFT